MNGRAKATRILVTGAAGFAGRHLARELVRHGHTVVGLDRDPGSAAAHDGCERLACDLRDAAQVRERVRHVRPDACVHLGAMTFVPEGRAQPAAMLAVNVLGTVNLLEAVRELAPRARVLAVSTAQIYAPQDDAVPLDEDTLPAPGDVYAASKTAADLAALGYAQRYGLDCMTARPVNHTGPGQAERFAVPAFARQLRAIRNGHSEPVLRVGNLESRRDFLDVRDVVRAYRLLLLKGRGGQAYNVASGHLLSMGEILDRLCGIAGIRPARVTDAQRFRPADRTARLSAERLRRDTGWEPAIDLDRTLRDVFEEGDT